MKHSAIRKFACVALGLAFFVEVFVPVFAQNRQSLEGTWTTVVTPVNCQTGDAVAPSFPGILTFAKGGTMSGTSAAVPPVFGVWEQTRGWDSATFAFTNLRFNSNGVLIGSQVVRQDAILFNENAFSSTGTAQLLDLNGNVIGNGCANSLAGRFQ
jgi:hypothetical protein